MEPSELQVGSHVLVFDPGRDVYDFRRYDAWSPYHEQRIHTTGIVEQVDHFHRDARVSFSDGTSIWFPLEVLHLSSYTIPMRPVSKTVTITPFEWGD